MKLPSGNCKTPASSQQTDRHAHTCVGRPEQTEQCSPPSPASTSERYAQAEEIRIVIKDKQRPGYPTIPPHLQMRIKGRKEWV